MATPTTSPAIIDIGQDPTVTLGANAEAIIRDYEGRVAVYETNKDIYITVVDEVTQQQFPTNNINNPGGDNYQLQYNLNGEFAGSDALTFNPISNSLNVANLVSTGPLNIPNVANFKLGGGTPSYFLQTQDGNGTLAWVAAPGAGNGSPGGTIGQIQYNNSGSFGGVTGFSFANGVVTIANVSIANLTVTGNITGGGSNQSSNVSSANTVVIGTPSAPVATTTSMATTTSSTTANQTVVSVPNGNVSALDFAIISTDTNNQVKQINKVLAIWDGTTLNYTEYSAVSSGTAVADFIVVNVGGNIQLQVTPTTANIANYSIVYTIYR